MPRNKVLEKAKVTMPSGRSPFDLSQIRSFDALAGEIGVCYCQPMVAGTKGKISRRCFTRTAEVVSPAFHSVTEHFDFFIVPIHSLWRSWENWKLNINDLQDTLTVPFNGLNNAPDLTLPSYAPRMNFNNIIDRTFNIGQTFASSDAAEAVAHRAHDALRLLDQLGYDEFVGANTSGTAKVMNILCMGAYQKCYFDHFRNTAYESNNPYAYNFDWLYDSHLGLLDPDANSVTPSATKDIYVAEQLFKIRRVNYRNDYFHNIYPALNYVLSSPSGQGWVVPSNTGGFYPSANSVPSAIGNNGGTVLVASALQTTPSSSAPISVQQLRAAFALDKLMRASAYAPKHVREQYKALYGVDGVEDFDMKSERIGSFQSDVAFQEVTNMTQSGNFDLGLLGAKGVGGDDNSKPINFYCKYDSIVIGLHYFMPRARYDSLGLHPWNIKIAREDFYIKAFENLGLRPFYAHYIDGQRAFGTIVGWSVPNFEYKILPDLNTGAFKRKFCIYNQQGSGPYTLSLDNQRTSELSTYVPHNETVFTGSAATAEYFKVAPEDLDNLFKVPVYGDHGRDYFQFFGEFRISVPVVAPMSVHGQPSL